MTARSPRVGLALGGGGARGLSHILVLQAFDELGIAPSCMSGTSIGALMGAAYASGMSAGDIDAYLNGLLSRRSALLRHIYSRWKGSIFDYWTARVAAAFHSQRIMELILPKELPARFEDLIIPLETVAADFGTYEQHVSSSGPLLPALAASAALPALLTPVKVGGHMLIDGGFVNPLPYDLLLDKADVIVAVDVSGGPTGEIKSPGLIGMIVGAQQIALHTIVCEKLKNMRPHILVRPPVGAFGALDFLRKEAILRAAEPVKDEVKRRLEAYLD